jgi:hypothetical protein
VIAFRPELFEAKARAQEALEQSGLLWLRDYGCCDVLHEEYGVELEGFSDRQTALEALRVLRRSFPSWRFSCVWYRHHMDAKWCCSICKLARACG